MGNEHSTLSDPTGTAMTPAEKERAKQHARLLEEKRLSNLAKRRAEREAAVEREAAEGAIEQERKHEEELAAAAERARGFQEANAVKIEPPSGSKAAWETRIADLELELAVQRKRVAGLVSIDSKQRANVVVRGGPARVTPSSAVPVRSVAPTHPKSGERDGRQGADVAPTTQTFQAVTNDDECTRRSSLDSAVALPQAAKQRLVDGKAGPITAATGSGRRASDDHSRGVAASGPSAKRPSQVDHLETISDSDNAAKRLRTSAPSLELPRSSTSTVESTGERQPPRWYSSLSVEHRRSKEDATVQPLLQSLKTMIRHAKTQPDSRSFNKIRHSLHTLPFVKVHEKMLRNNGMLHNEAGLPQLFDVRYSGGVHWPFDLQADAQELYNKWCSRIFETDLLRGIIPGNGKSGAGEKSSDRLDRNWHTVDPAYHGNGKLINGQWWPTQLAALRDGAHGSAQAGIHGRPGYGAFSCIMAGNHEYSHKDDGDKDEGEVVSYCGTDSVDGTITSGTKLMLENVADGRPVRLIRSHKVQSEYAPRIGLRYDGLYDVVDCGRLDSIVSSRQRHRFKLVRQAGQDPIRGGNSPATRPTQQEIEAHQKDKRLRGIGSGGGGGGAAIKGKKGETFPTWG